jgi:hypothetical protein
MRVAASHLSVGIVRGGAGLWGEAAESVGFFTGCWNET